MENNPSNGERWKRPRRGKNGRERGNLRGGDNVRRIPNYFKRRHQRESDGDHSPPNKRRKTRPMGFTFLNKLLQNDDTEDIVLQLTNDGERLQDLFQDKDLKNDFVVMIVKLLSKICESSFGANVASLLEKALKSNFSESLIIYVSKLALQDGKEKTFNQYFWDDPNDFWNDIIKLSKTVQNLIPTNSCEVVARILKAVKLYIPIIEDAHHITVSDEVKNSTESLYETVQATIAKFERPKDHEKSNMGNKLEDEQPPNDFRQISIYPNTSEVTIPGDPFLRANVIDGPYQDVNHYLDVQYRLLREDFVRTLRIGICKYRDNQKSKLDDIKIHKLITFLNMEIVNELRCYRIQFDFTKRKKSFEYERSRRFMYGSLLCFTNDNFKTLLCGKVVQRELKDLKMGQIVVGFNEDVLLPDNLNGHNYLMVESTVYFEPYYQVLNVLKTIQPECFPFEKYIIKVDTEPKPPEYLLTKHPPVYTIQSESFCPLDWGHRKFYSLNDAQQRAFKAALTQEFVVIQGPPGTGKTHLALKIVETLTENLEVWYKASPILVICYTNHALDQFLEGVVTFTERILRVGGQSKNKMLDKYNIRSYTKSLKYSDPAREVQNCIKLLNTIKENLNVIIANKSILDFEIFDGVIPEYSHSSLKTMNKDQILQWFLSREVTGYSAAPEMGWNGKEELRGDVENNEEEINMKEIIDVNQILDDDFNYAVVTKCKTLIDIKELRSWIATLFNELNKIEKDKNLSRWGRHCKKEKIKHEICKIEYEITYLKTILDYFKDNPPTEPPQYIDLENPERMNPKARWQLYFYWLNIYVKKMQEKEKQLTKDFQKKKKFTVGFAI